MSERRFFHRIFRKIAMNSRRHIPKWGFGMSPLSARMQGRYDLAVDAVLDFLEGDLDPDELDPGLVSELKGMFNRCLRQDQWDWFTVLWQFGKPERREMRRFVSFLSELRRGLVAGDYAGIAKLKAKLRAADLLPYLHNFQRGGPPWDADGVSGWIYILSTRDQPTVLKIGMTRRPVFQRVKEINRATGILVPFSARAVFRVPDAVAAERMVFTAFSQYRIRPDREFFEIEFSVASRQIETLLTSSKECESS